jgi:hypothetical protein
MIESRTHAGRSVVVVDVVVFVAVALAGVITVDHGHDLLRLSQECGTGLVA